MSIQRYSTVVVQVQGPSSILLTCQIVHKDLDQRECSGIILNSVKSNIIKLYQTQRPESFAIESFEQLLKVQNNLDLTFN